MSKKRFQANEREAAGGASYRAGNGPEGAMHLSRGRVVQRGDLSGHRANQESDSDSCFHGVHACVFLQNTRKSTQHLFIHGYLPLNFALCRRYHFQAAAIANIRKTSVPLIAWQQPLWCSIIRSGKESEAGRPSGALTWQNSFPLKVFFWHRLWVKSETCSSMLIRHQQPAAASGSRLSAPGCCFYK